MRPGEADDAEAGSARSADAAARALAPSVSVKTGALHELHAAAEMPPPAHDGHDADMLRGAVGGALLIDRE